MGIDIDERRVLTNRLDKIRKRLGKVTTSEEDKIGLEAERDRILTALHPAEEPERQTVA